ncbi:NYN domain-containing protein [Actinopolymorpha singaporensis]|uniref:NYN domain-containing protein n=1 Tax=Actinopolymorpha singaporensis TaxID=117157 RepID=A0A1H1UHP6_9ACTN|nr:NYN domain-containing protein [Actinopolymorpha singaporensis]SDS71968.1 NYN domain-containing protein [Actinopolymorpha singaporensis]
MAVPDLRSAVFATKYAILIDVGYLYAATAEVLFGARERREYRVSADELIQALQKHAVEHLPGELLRVYWYDAAHDRVPTVDQRVIAALPMVKLRLGNLNKQGQQKGVDAQIRADLDALARHGAVTDVVLLAGDEDLVPAVEAAQAYGVRIHLWGVEPSYGSNQAERLVWESDFVEVLAADLLRPYVRQSQPLSGSAPTPASAPSTADSVTALAHEPSTADGTTPGPTAPGPSGPSAPGAAKRAQAGGQAGTPTPAQVFAGRAGTTTAVAGAGSVRPPRTDSPNATPTPGPAAGPAPAPASAAADGGPTIGAQGAGPRLGPDRNAVEEVGEHVAQKWILTRGRDHVRDLLPGPILPTVIDSELLAEAEKELGHSLRPYPEARVWLRDGFWTRLGREFELADHGDRAERGDRAEHAERRQTK